MEEHLSPSSSAFYDIKPGQSRPGFGAQRGRANRIAAKALKVQVNMSDFVTSHSCFSIHFMMPGKPQINPFIRNRHPADDFCAALSEKDFFHLIPGSVSHDLVHYFVI